MSCHHEAAVTQAARRDSWTAELRTHLATCPDCQEAVALVEQLVALAATTAAAAPPPRSAHALWLRAEYARRASARTRLAHWQGAAAVAAPGLAVIGFTLVGGMQAWADLGPLATQSAAAIAIGLAAAAWVMITPSMGSAAPAPTAPASPATAPSP